MNKEDQSDLEDFDAYGEDDPKNPLDSYQVDFDQFQEVPALFKAFFSDIAGARAKKVVNQNNKKLKTYEFKDFKIKYSFVNNPTGTFSCYINLINIPVKLEVLKNFHMELLSPTLLSVFFEYGGYLVKDKIVLEKAASKAIVIEKYELAHKVLKITFKDR